MKGLNLNRVARATCLCRSATSRPERVGRTLDNQMLACKVDALSHSAGLVAQRHGQVARATQASLCVKFLLSSLTLTFILIGPRPVVLGEVAGEVVIITWFAVVVFFVPADGVEHELRALVVIF